MTDQSDEEHAPTTILTQDRRVHVFISSAIGELADERVAARNAIEQLFQTPVYFESSARPHPPRAVYRSLLEQSDVFVGVYWESHGWIAPDMELSGIEDEYVLSQGMPRLIYVKEPAPERTPRLVALLDRIRGADDAVYKRFGTAEELRRLLSEDLALVLAERFLQEARNDQEPVLPGLPRPSSSFVGRQRLLARCGELLRDAGVRLITLLGPGGSGKTRVAIEAARQAEGEFPNGVAFVDLAPLTDPESVPAAILQALRLRETMSGSPRETITTYLADKDALLVLDNFEHGLEVAPLVSAILGNCPGTMILVTSRSPLRLVGDHEVPVDTMELPALKPLPALADLKRNEAVDLFVQRARSIRPDFTLSADNAGAVAGACARLDGLPLAIELAAARIRVFPNPAALLSALDQRLPLLVGGPRDAPQRQQTMRDAIAWSNDLLSLDQQALFRRLGVFSGGCTFEAGATVALTMGPIDNVFLDEMDNLIAASLLRVESSSAGTRLSMLETIREFAIEQLSAHQEFEIGSDAHASYFAEMSVNLSKRFGSVPNPRWFQSLDEEADNFTAALVWSWERQLDGVLTWIVWHLWRYWNVRGYVTEGRKWLHRAIERSTSQESFFRADLLLGAGELARRQTDFESAKQYLRRALAIWTRLGDARMRTALHLALGATNYDQRNIAGARVHFGKARTIARAAGDQRGIASAEVGLGGIAVDLGDDARAHKYLENAKIVLEALGLQGDDAALGSCLSHLARLAHAEGDPTRAADLLDASRSLAAAVGDTRGQITSLLEAARLAQQRGDQRDAETLRDNAHRLAEQMGDQQGKARTQVEQARFDQGLTTSQRMGLLGASLDFFLSYSDRQATAEGLDTLAFLLINIDPAAAVTSYEIADFLRDRSGVALHSSDKAKRAGRLIELRNRIGSQLFEEARRRGAEFDPDVNKQSFTAWFASLVVQS